MDKSDISDIKDVLNKIFKENNMPDLNISKLKKRWADIVGEQLVDHTIPYRIYNKELIIRCDHQGWINTLQFYKKEIIGKIKNIFNKDIVIDDVKFFFNYKNKKD